jgi:MOSC domain-containing protein YiiM
MKTATAKVVSVHIGASGDLAKQEHDSIEVALDGIVGDRHRSLQRLTWEGDKQAEGTVRRNERHWSAIAIEEVEKIARDMDLAESLHASSLGVNFCLEGVPELSRLPMGTILKFPSGAELMVEEYNPPCLDMGAKLAAMHTTNSGEPLSNTAFSQAAKFCRGIVGVVEVSGVVFRGDEVRVEYPHLPKWLRDS